MKLLSILQKPYTKQRAMEIVDWIGKDQKKFNELLYIFLNNEDHKIVQRAAWPLSYAAVSHSELIKMHFEPLVKRLQVYDQPAAVKRNILRIFDKVLKLPEIHHGDIMNSCFDCIADPKEAIATQAFALGVLGKLCKQYPEIKSELVLVIESRLPNAAPAFKSRAKKVLKLCN